MKKKSEVKRDDEVLICDLYGHKFKKAEMIGDVCPKCWCPDVFPSSVILPVFGVRECA